MSTKSILIVDDNPDEILMIKRIIHKHNPKLNLSTAMNGNDALQLLCAKEESIYSLAFIFLDLKMPGMNGIDVLRQIRSSRTCHYLPVVILTSSNLKSDIEESYSAGANSFIQKSADYKDYTDKLIMAVNYWVMVNSVPE